MKNAIRLGRIWGIEIGLDYSWFVIFVLIVWSLSAHYFPMNYPWGTATSWAVGIATSLLFFASILAHELGHSFVAIRKGIPVRSITLFIFGGVAQITREPRKPRDEFWIAVAGPVVSAMLGILFLSLPAGSGDATAPAAALGAWLGSINISVAFFNLIPGFPLDGGRILRAALWSRTGSFLRATHIASRTGEFVAYGFVFAGVFLFIAGRGVEGLWIGFIGWFLNNAAAANFQQVTLQQQLAGTKTQDVMMTDCPPVHRAMTLDRLVYDHMLPSGRRCFLVVENGRTYGVVTVHNTQSIPERDWPTITVGQIMTPIEDARTVGPDDDLFSVLQMMATEDINQFPVVKDGRLLGMIARDRVLGRIALEPEAGTSRLRGRRE